MPKNMGFSMTIRQLYDGTKTVTRRLGWGYLKPGDIVCAVERNRGLKKGEGVKKIGLIEIQSVTRERLDQITQEDCIREGFPDMKPEQFVDMFMRSCGCPSSQIVNRISFKRLYKPEEEGHKNGYRPRDRQKDYR